ncbi:MAG: DEAD/DEAH box helicase, partial [Flavobacteriales bacterium]|nr:DEAD/DEAH box helicase [Flavobacteriales bacterium]
MGFGKTYSLLIPILEEILNSPKKKGLRAIWITPIRALTKEIKGSAERAMKGMGLEPSVAIRTGDTPTKEKQAQKKNMPSILITTPESMHVLFSNKDQQKLVKNISAVVVDEWHEL